MPKNVIIITTGLSGSSLLSAALQSRGYFAGAATHKKRDYDTGESRTLIALNETLIARSGFTGRFQDGFSARHFDRIAALYDEIDLTPFAAFLEDCRGKMPWLWKDPRLCFTLGFWLKLLEPGEAAVLYLGRDPVQHWVSNILRRQIMSRRYLDAHNEGVRGAAKSVVAQAGQAWAEFEIDDLYRDADAAAARLSRFLDLTITPSDIDAASTRPVTDLRHGPLDHAKAWMIYAKNIRWRIG